MNHVKKEIADNLRHSVERKQADEQQKIVDDKNYMKKLSERYEIIVILHCVKFNKIFIFVQA